jgi:hypothetical protein
MRIPGDVFLPEILLVGEDQRADAARRISCTRVGRTILPRRDHGRKAERRPEDAGAHLQRLRRNGLALPLVFGLELERFRLDGPVSPSPLPAWQWLSMIIKPTP